MDLSSSDSNLETLLVNEESTEFESKIVASSRAEYQDKGTGKLDLEVQALASSENNSYLNYIEKCRANRQAFSGINTFPVPQEEGLAKISMTYYIYFRQYFIMLQLCVIVMLIRYLLDSFEDFFSYSKPGLYVLLTSLAIRYLRRLEEKKLLQDKTILSADWTEDKFGLLLEGLPQDTNENEIRTFLNDILSLHSVNDTGIKYVLMLQDCEEFIKSNSPNPLSVISKSI